MTASNIRLREMHPLPIVCREATALIGDCVKRIGLLCFCHADVARSALPLGPQLSILRQPPALGHSQMRPAQVPDRGIARASSA